ncbi:hypothetical protein HY642_01385 [Candidatus Woesearchaeota archaeon]|nr:hypothetical protein [Candidatus Woesearchaeota archaeon]
MMPCKRCGKPVRSYSVMRKWCVECRHHISLEQAKLRRGKPISEEVLKAMLAAKRKGTVET